MDDEAMKAMAERIADEHTGPDNRGHYLWEPRYAVALAAIIETRDRDAALADGWGMEGTDEAAIAADIAAAIRSGQQFRENEK